MEVIVHLKLPWGKKKSSFEENFWKLSSKWDFFLHYFIYFSSSVIF